MEGVPASQEQEQSTTATLPLPRVPASNDDHEANNITPEDEETELSEVEALTDLPNSTTMASSTQKRWLTQPNSQIAKGDIFAILRQEEAWDSLPREARQSLYDMLPQPVEGEPPHDIDVHPLKTQYKPYIEEGIRTWQQDLLDGREVKSWRDEAMQAEQDRQEGKWDEFKTYQREADWGSEDGTEDGEDGEVKVGLKDVASDGDGDGEVLTTGESSEGEEIEVKNTSYMTMAQTGQAKTSSTKVGTKENLEAVRRFLTKLRPEDSPDARKKISRRGGRGT